MAKTKELSQIFSLPQGVTGQHLKDFGQSILKQLVKPNGKKLDLKLAARDAQLPIDVNPTALVESSPFRLFLESAGLTPNFFAECLYEDIISKPGKRVLELRLLAQVMGIMNVESVSPAERANQNTAKSLDLIEKILDNQHEGRGNKVINIDPVSIN